VSPTPSPTPSCMPLSNAAESEMLTRDVHPSMPNDTQCGTCATNRPVPVPQPCTLSSCVTLEATCHLLHRLPLRACRCRMPPRARCSRATYTLACLTTPSAVPALLTDPYPSLSHAHCPRAATPDCTRSRRTEAAPAAVLAVLPLLPPLRVVRSLKRSLHPFQFVDFC